jgi:hypothetical protein
MPDQPFVLGNKGIQRSQNFWDIEPARCLEGRERVPGELALGEKELLQSDRDCQAKAPA